MQNKGFCKGFCGITHPCMCVLSFFLFCDPLSHGQSGTGPER